MVVKCKVNDIAFHYSCSGKRCECRSFLSALLSVNTHGVSIVGLHTDSKELFDSYCCRSSIRDY